MDIDLEHDDAEHSDDAEGDAHISAEAAVGAQRTRRVLEQGDSHADCREMTSEEGEERTEEVDSSEAEGIVVLSAVDRGDHHHAQRMDA